MKKFFKTLALSILVIFFLGNTVITISNGVSLRLIMNAQIYILELQDFYNEINTERNKLLEGKLKQSLEEVQAKEEKPSFTYIQSMVVRILNIIDEKSGDGAIGTGTIVKITEDYTYILTNNHVAPKGSKFILVEKDLKRYTAEVVKNGVARDLSLIRIVGKIKGAVAIKGLRKIKEQDKVYSVGMYLGEYNIYTEGTVAGWRGDSRLLNMPCLYGCSGSGVFDKDGYMVAIVYAVSQYTMFGGVDTAEAICVPYIGILTFLEEIL